MSNVLDVAGIEPPAPLPPDALSGSLHLRTGDGREAVAAIGLVLTPDGVSLALRAVVLLGGTLPAGGRVTATYPPFASTTFGRTVAADGNTPAPAFVAELVATLGLSEIV